MEPTSLDSRGGAKPGISGAHLASRGSRAEIHRAPIVVHTSPLPCQHTSALSATSDARAAGALQCFSRANHRWHSSAVEALQPLYDLHSQPRRACRATLVATAPCSRSMRCKLASGLALLARPGTTLASAARSPLMAALTRARQAAVQQPCASAKAALSACSSSRWSCSRSASCTPTATMVADDAVCVPRV